jgi:hypothetical protein
MTHRPKPIDVAHAMRIEEALAVSLKEWAEAGGPVMGVVDRISALIDEKIRLAQQASEPGERA